MWLRLHKDWQRVGVMRPVETGNNELKGDRRELSGKGMRNLYDFAVILARLGQMHHAVQNKNELRK